MSSLAPLGRGGVANPAGPGVGAWPSAGRWVWVGGCMAYPVGAAGDTGRSFWGRGYRTRRPRKDYQTGGGGLTTTSLSGSPPLRFGEGGWGERLDFPRQGARP